MYELFSVMVHSGSAAGGHYYAYIKSFEDNRWYSFNDQVCFISLFIAFLPSRLGILPQRRSKRGTLVQTCFGISKLQRSA